MSEWHTLKLNEDELRLENIELRKTLALIYSSHLYTDDGEFSCGAEHPTIDFKRMAVSEIQDAIRKRNQAKLARLSPDEVAKILSSWR